MLVSDKNELDVVSEIDASNDVWGSVVVGGIIASLDKGNRSWGLRIKCKMELPCAAQGGSTGLMCRAGGKRGVYCGKTSAGIGDTERAGLV